MSARTFPTNRLEKPRLCACPEELDGFLSGVRQFGPPLSDDETKAAQALRSRFLKREKAE